MAKSQKSPCALYPGLAFDVKCELSPANAKALEKYYADAAQFTADVAALHADRAKLLRSCRSMTLDAARKAGAELVARKRALEDTARGLLWQRYDLNQDMEPDHQAEVQRAKDHYEKTIAAETERFAELGVTFVAMPAGYRNMKAAEEQLRSRVMQELPCLAALERMRHAEAALKGVLNTRNATPDDDAVRIRWQDVSEDLEEMARLTGVN